MSVKAATSERVEETASKPHSAALIGDLLRLLDVALILLLGLSIYLLYVYPEGPHTVSRYLVTVFVATIISGTTFHWLGVYWGGFLFTRGLRIDRMLVALVIAFALLLSMAFALKISNFYSRVWLVTWFFSSAVVLSVTRLYLGHYIALLAHRGRFANRTVIVGTGTQCGTSRIVTTESTPAISLSSSRSRLSWARTGREKRSRVGVKVTMRKGLLA